MEEKIIKADFEQGKVLVLRRSVGPDGQEVEELIEKDLPLPPMKKGIIRVMKRGEDGRMYEEERVIESPVFEKNREEER